MSISFTCPHCKKAYKVKDELAGRKATCAGCKKSLTIPKLAPAAKPNRLEGITTAAAPTPSTESAVQPTPSAADAIEVTCMYCDARFRVGSELAGKNAPCPECRKIVKVQAQVKKEPIDWRRPDAPQGPSAVRAESSLPPALAASGMAAGAATAAPKRPRPPAEEDELELLPRFTREQIIHWAIGATVAVGILFGLVWLTLNYLDSRRQRIAIAEALAAATPEDGQPSILNKIAAAEVYRAAGEHALRARSAQVAAERLRMTRSLLAEESAGAQPTRDALLIDVALLQVDLGGTEDQEISETHLSWDNTLSEIRQTVSRIVHPDARAVALQEVTRKLIAKEQPLLAISLARQMMPTEAVPESLAQVGLVLFQNGHRDLAETVADDSLHLYAQLRQLITEQANAKPLDEEEVEPIPNPNPPPGDPPPVGPARIDPDAPPDIEEVKPVAAPEPEDPYRLKHVNFPGSLQALHLALRKPAANFSLDMSKPLTAQTYHDEMALIKGHAVGWMLQGNANSARLFTGPRSQLPNARVQAILPGERLRVLHAIVTSTSPPDASWIADAVQIVQGARVQPHPGQVDPSWALWWLARVALAAGQEDEARKLVQAIPHPHLKGLAQLEMLRHRLQNTSEHADQSWAAEIDANVPAYGLAMEAIARHNAYHAGGRATLKEIRSWQPETIQPLGKVGAALGMQD